VRSHVSVPNLRPHDDLFSLPEQDRLTPQELAQAIETSVTADDSAQMYADVILQHTWRLHNAGTIIGRLEAELLAFRTRVGGDITRIGILLRLAGLAPGLHSGDPIPVDMTRALFQCYSGTHYSFQNLLLCLKRFTNKLDIPPTLARPESTNPVDTISSPPSNTFRTSPSCRLWKEPLRGIGLLATGMHPYCIAPRTTNLTSIFQEYDSYHSSNGHYNFTTFKALNSYHFPSTSFPALQPWRQVRRGVGIHPITGGRSLALSTITKRGGRFVIIHLYQFTAAHLAERDEVWDIIKAWILKHLNDRIILIGDFNCAPAGGRTGYSLPPDNILKADDSLHDFCQGTGGALVSSKYHSWSRGNHRATLDNAITWNYHLSNPKVCSFASRHQSYDNGVLRFALPVEDFISTLKALKRNCNIPSDRVDVVFF